MNYYYLSLGSNINPRENINTAINLIGQRYQIIKYYPVISTTPFNIKTSNYFYNTLLVIFTQKDHSSLKLEFEEMETLLGRDRSDPMRSKKDREIDIDIITSSTNLNLDLFLMSEEPYVKKISSMK